MGMMTLRAEKTTQNRDDMRTLLFGIMASILIMFSAPLAQRYFDIYVLDRPLVRATLELQQFPDNGIVISYDADAVKPVDATWIASVYLESGKRISSRRGEGAYSDTIDGPRLWSWSAFFGQEDGTPAPPVPVVPFYICVRYIATTRDTGVSDDSGLFCSDPITVKGG